MKRPRKPKTTDTLDLEEYVTGMTVRELCETYPPDAKLGSSGYDDLVVFYTRELTEEELSFRLEVYAMVYARWEKWKSEQDLKVEAAKEAVRAKELATLVRLKAKYE